MIKQPDTIPMGLRSIDSFGAIDQPAPLEHIGIVVRGHRTWAHKAGVPTGFALAGAVSELLEIIHFCIASKTRHVTLYLFRADVGNLLDSCNRDVQGLTLRFLKNSLNSLLGKDVRVRVLGDTRGLSEHFRALAEQAVQQSSGNDGMVLTIAIDGYQGASEQHNTPAASGIQPEFVVRLGGNLPVDCPMFWDTAATRLYTTDKLWPDFGLEDMKAAIRWYRKAAHNVAPHRGHPH